VHSWRGVCRTVDDPPQLVDDRSDRPGIVGSGSPPVGLWRDALSAVFEEIVNDPFMDEEVEVEIAFPI